MRVIELTGPADAHFLSTARTVAVSVSAQAGLSVDACDELCLAVDEACGALQLAGTAALLVSFVIDADIRVTIRSSRPQMVTVDATSRVVMSTMTDGFDVDSADGAIRLMKHVN
jgi:hypothetical protein